MNEYHRRLGPFKEDQRTHNMWKARSLWIASKLYKTSSDASEPVSGESMDCVCNIIQALRVRVADERGDYSFAILVSSTATDAFPSVKLLIDSGRAIIREERPFTDFLYLLRGPLKLEIELPQLEPSHGGVTRRTVRVNLLDWPLPQTVSQPPRLYLQSR
jgi:hypothetical protein